MYLRQAIALAVALAALGGIVIASASYYSWERSRLVQSFSQSEELPSLQPYVNSLSLVAYEFVENLSSVSTPSQVESIIEIAQRELTATPQLAPLFNQAYEAFNLTRMGGSYYLLSQSYYSKGDYALAAYYANLSLQYLARANATLYTLISYIYVRQAELGPQVYQSAMALAHRALATTGLFTEEDYIELKIIQLSVAKKVNGVVTVNLNAPRHYVLGQTFYVNGTVLVNGSSPLGNSLVEIGVGNLTTLVTSNPSGHFSVELRPIYNASGLECVYAKVVSDSAIIINRSLTSYACGPLSFVPTHLNISVSPSTVMPGKEILVHIVYSNATCRPSYAVTLGALSYSGVIVNGSATVSITVPPGLSGYSNVTVTASPYGSCGPSTATARVYVYRPPDRPSELTAWGLSPGLLVIYGTSPTPSRLSVSFENKSVYMTVSRGAFITVVPLPQLQLSYSVGIAMYPVNVTFAPYSETVRLVTIPTEAPIAVAAALLYMSRRRRHRPALPSPPELKTSIAALSDAWNLLVRIGSRLGVPVLPSTTIRELSSAIALRRRELAEKLSSLADLMERAAYGGLRDEVTVGSIRKLVDELRRSERL